MKRIIATALCLIMIASLTLTSCSSPKSETVFAYGDVSMDENMFFYELSLMKTEMLEQYSGATTDVPALWMQSLGDGVTFDDYAYAQCQLNICTVLFFADYALQHGGALTKEEKQAVNQQVDGIIEKFGSKAALNKYLETYTINYDMLCDYYELYSLYNKGLALAYGEGGDMAIPYEDMWTYYQNNFVTVKHIAIGTEFAGTDEDGNYIYYTEEEKEAKHLLVDTIIAALENGEDFDKYVEYSEDGFKSSYPNGYTITRGVLDSSMEGYEKLAFSLAEGEWDTFELEGTGVFIVKRVPLLESDFANCASTIVSNLVQADMGQTVVENYDSFTMNQDVLDRYNMAMMPVVS